MKAFQYRSICNTGNNKKNEESGFKAHLQSDSLTSIRRYVTPGHCAARNDFQHSVRNNIYN